MKSWPKGKMAIIAAAALLLAWVIWYGLPDGETVGKVLGEMLWNLPQATEESL